MYVFLSHSSLLDNDIKSTKYHTKVCNEVKYTSWPQITCPREHAMTSKSTPWRQKVRNDIKMYAIAVKNIMTSQSTSWRQKVCHNIKVRYDVKKFVITSKSTSWRQMYVMTSNNTSWRQKVRHDVKKYVLISKCTPLR